MLLIILLQGRRAEVWLFDCQMKCFSFSLAYKVQRRCSGHREGDSLTFVPMLKLDPFFCFMLRAVQSFILGADTFMFHSFTINSSNEWPRSRLADSLSISAAVGPSSIEAFRLFNLRLVHALSWLCSRVEWFGMTI